MDSFSGIVLKLASRPLVEFNHHYKHSSERLVYAGWIGFYGFILFYFIYTVESGFSLPVDTPSTNETVSFRPAEFENIWIRLIASVACLALALKPYWPSRLAKYYLTYSYIVILYCLPFFHTHMVLISNGHIAYLIDAMVALFLMILLVDWLNVLVMYLIGTLAALLIFIIIPANTFENNWPVSYVACLPNMILAILGGALFHFNNYQVEKEKIKAIASVGGSMAHELINPLFAIRCLTQAIRQDLTVFDKSAPKKNVTTRIYNELSRIDSIAKRSGRTITMILSTANRGPIKTSQFGYFKISECIAETLLDCNQLIKNKQIDTQSIINTKNGNDFLFYGSKDLLVNVLLNLINNSLYFIKKHKKGIISLDIKSESISSTNDLSTKYNCLTISDTAIGIPKDVLPFIFDDFYTTRSDQGGSGLGLGFCRRVLKSFGGDIICKSKYGEYCSFTLLFPVIEDKVSW